MSSPRSRSRTRPRRRLLATAGAAWALACVASPGTVRPDVLGYRVPDVGPATYAFADTTVFRLDAGPMGPMELISARSGVAELELREGPTGLEALVRFPEYAGRLESPGQGAVTAAAVEIAGAVRLRVGSRGDIAIVDAPALGAAAATASAPGALVRPLFVRLPDRATVPGDVWVDTLDFSDEGPDTTTRVYSIVTSTLVGDTLAGGRAVLHIRTASVDQVEVEGVSGGVRVRRRLAGVTRGRVLWDPRRDLLVERTEEGELSGTLDMPDVGVSGLPVQARVRRTVSLRS